MLSLSKFPASKVRQMAKKLESLQSTARHIKEDVKRATCYSDKPPKASETWITTYQVPKKSK